MSFACSFELEGVAGTEVQIIAEGLGDDDATRFVESQFGSHNPILSVVGPTAELLEEFAQTGGGGCG
jgi:hypothetical protein